LHILLHPHEIAKHLISSLAGVFESARILAQECSEKTRPPEPEDLRHLDHRARVILGLFAENEVLFASQVASELGLSERMARNLLSGWVKDGWLEAATPSRRARSYRLTANYRQYIGRLSEMDQK